MKKLLLIPFLAAVALFAQPVFAVDAPQGAQAAQEETAGQAMHDHESMMQESMKKMQAQMAKIHETKDAKKRMKLLQEHSKSMHDSVKMMHGMMGGMTMECPMMGGGHMMSGHMMGGNQASQSGDKTGAAPAAQTDQASTADKPSASQDKKLWTCPMHPNVIRDQPGTCPICGMDLVEKGASGAAQSGSGHMMGGCMMGGGMKCPMMGGSGGCMTGGDMKCPMMGSSGGCMMGGGMKGPMMGGKGCHMMGMANKHMDMMLMLMEQMIEHDEAAMAIRK